MDAMKFLSEAKRMDSKIERMLGRIKEARNG